LKVLLALLVLCTDVDVGVLFMRHCTTVCQFASLATVVRLLLLLLLLTATALSQAVVRRCWFCAMTVVCCSCRGHVNLAHMIRTCSGCYCCHCGCAGRSNVLLVLLLQAALRHCWCIDGSALLMLRKH
jgi:hypothetical protein